MKLGNALDKVDREVAEMRKRCCMPNYITPNHLVKHNTNAAPQFLAKRTPLLSGPQHHSLSRNLHPLLSGLQPHSLSRNLHYLLSGPQHHSFSKSLHLYTVVRSTTVSPEIYILYSVVCTSKVSSETYTLYSLVRLTFNIQLM